MLKTVIVCGAIVLVLTACGPRHPTYTPPKANEKNLQLLTDNVRQDLVFVPGGKFLMGDVARQAKNADGELLFPEWTPARNTTPVHEVELNGFSISRYEVTYWQFDLFSAATKRPLVASYYLDADSARHPQRAGEYPAGVSWHDAQAYCAWLGELTGDPFALPTEAQWESTLR